MINPNNFRRFVGFNQQSYMIGLSTFFAAALLFVFICMMSIIAYLGLSFFWPKQLYEVTFIHDGKIEQVYAQIDINHSDKANQINASSDLDVAIPLTSTVSIWGSSAEKPFANFVTVDGEDIEALTLSESGAEILLYDGRRVFAKPHSLSSPIGESTNMDDYIVFRNEVNVIKSQIEHIKSDYLAPIHKRVAELDRKGVEHDAPIRTRLQKDFVKWVGQVEEKNEHLKRYQLSVLFPDQSSIQLQISDIQYVYQVGEISVFEKVKYLILNIAYFLSDSPKQENTAGGVFPALFGTVLMVLLMTVIVTPFGVCTAIYLSEYAPNNPISSIIRVCIGNMAGIPSIVYGVFGLGFFVYAVGGNIDQLFFSDRLPAPTMGSPGLFWASLTMALLTLPVVVVSTEEGLRRVPDSLRDGSYALGATKLETISRIVIPIASPGIITGVILSVARAAGGVAPLMMVGAVKFAPSLPIDGEFPFLHLDRQFMHLGVMIYDGAFHSQVDGKSASMMFASCLLLLAVVFMLNIVAVILREQLRKRYMPG